MQHLLREPEGVRVVVSAHEQDSARRSALEQRFREHARQRRARLRATRDGAPIQRDRQTRQHGAGPRRPSPARENRHGAEASPDAPGPESEDKEVVALARLAYELRREEAEADRWP